MSKHDGALQSYNAAQRLVRWARGGDSSSRCARDMAEDFQCDAGRARHQLAQSLGVPEYALDGILQQSADGWYVDDAAYQAWLSE